MNVKGKVTNCDMGMYAYFITDGNGEVISLNRIGSEDPVVNGECAGAGRELNVDEVVINPEDYTGSCHVLCAFRKKEG